MRALPAGLQDHLSSGVTTLCRCWRMERTDGLVQGFTDHDRALSFDGVTYSATEGLASTGDVTKAGFAVGGLEIAGALTSAGLDAGDLRDGRYDGAAVELRLVNWAAPEERVLMRRGTLGEVTREDGAFRAEVRGPMQALETVRGRVFAPGCDADLGDARCGVDLAALEANATVVSADGALVTVSGLEAFAAGWFSGGGCVVETGSEAGARLAIGDHSMAGASAVLRLRPTVCALSAGDVLRLTPGCDKRFATCREKFANTLNFRGFPHMPGNDKALGYARSGS